MGKEKQWDHGNDKTGRYRGGKTKEDKASGAWSARFANRAARVEWQKNAKA